jgi:hypothetical protein
MLLSVVWGRRLSADFKERPMEEIRIGPKTNAFSSDRELLDYVLALRKDLIRTKPIMDAQITRLDNLLLSLPNLPITVVVQIYTRALWVTACDYEQEKNPRIKHISLLCLRDHFEEFRQAPEAVQEALRPHWLEWLDVLRTEEQKLNGRAGHA